MRKGVDNINKNKLFLLGILCALIMCVSGIYAFTATTTTSVKNEMKTGGVNIQLTEYSVENGGQEVEYIETERIVMPGQTVSLIPRISNLGASSYIRVRLSYTSNGTNLNLTDDCIGGMSDDWTKVENYWYLKTPLENNAKIDIFKNITIPADITNENQGKTLQINIVAEAIQSRNLAPDFESTEPWGDTEILENDNETYQMAKVQISDAVKVQYENGANELLDVPDDFLSGLSALMPGDTISQDIITKAAPGAVRYLFSVVPQEQADEKINDLLQKLELEIKYNGNVVFEGNLNQEFEQVIGSANEAESGKFTVTVKMPEDLNNNYAMLNVPIVWTFKAEVTQTPPASTNYTNNYKVEIVNVKDDGKTVISSNEAIFVVNGKEMKTENGIVTITSVKANGTSNELDEYKIIQRTAPEGYNKYNDTIDLKIGFKVDSEIKKYVIDSEKTSCTALGLSEGMYIISSDNQKITIYVINKEVIPEPEPEPTPIPETKGQYTIELVKVQEDGETILKTGEAIFTVNNNNIGTKEGILTIASDKKITGVNQIDTYTIKEKKAPDGYSKYTGNITLKVAFKKNEEKNTYVIDETKTKIDATGMSGKVYSISEDGLKLTIYVPNKKIPAKPAEASPQTGDVKVKIAIAIFIVAALCLILIFVLEKRSKDKNK